MNAALRHHPPRAGRSAFTVTELLVAVAIASVILAAVSVFFTTGMRTVQQIATQAIATRGLAETQARLGENVRAAISLTVANNGNHLTLAFDENPAADSNGDGDPYNDTNRVARFEFRNGDGRDATTTNNSLVLIPNTTLTNEFRVLLPAGVRKLPGLPVFTLASTNRVQINLGTVDNVGNSKTQNAEMKATLVRRN
jgi:prepilin-type N-terminal cleavage/methylation domain-containing protein